MKLKLSVLAVTSALVLGGCVTSDFSRNTAHEKVQGSTSTAVKNFKTQESRAGAVTEHDQQFVSFKAVKMARPEGTVSMKAAGAPVGPSISDVARQAGYSIVFADGVDAARKVTAEFNKAQPEDVIRNLSFLAGYAAIFDRENKTITIAQTATYTYKLPPAVFQQLASQYTIGGNPVTQGGGSGGGGASGGGGGGGGMQASFTITGREGTNASGVEKMIRDIAGKNAEVTVSEMGLITVRSNAQSLKRTTEFFKNFSKDALTQVEIEASIIEVTLSDDFQFGLDWKKVLGAKLFGSDTNVALNFSPTNIINSTMQATFTTANITTVITSLRKLTDAKIISQPRILAMNNTPSNFFDGTQLPYLGTLTSTTTGAGGVGGGGTQLSGTTSQAVDGISFSVQPSVIDDRHVQITLLPVLSTVQGFETFDLGASGKLTSPKQSTKQSFMKVMAESGKTLILGGIRYSVDSKNTSAGPVPLLIQGRDTNAVAKEVVILLRATVIAAPEYNPIVSESV